MDEKLQTLWELYEAVREAKSFRSAAPETGDSALREERDSMREMKALLDSRPRQKPSARVVEAVLQAAARQPSTAEGARRDRAPIARRPVIYLRVGAVSAIVIVLLMVVSLIRLDVLKGTMPDDRITADKNEVKAGATDQLTDGADAAEAVEQQALSAAPEADAPLRSTRAAAPDRRDSVTLQTTAAPAWSQTITPGQRLAVSGRSAEGQGARPSFERIFDAQTAALRTANARPDETSMSDVLDWDPSGDMMEVYHHIEMIGGGVDRGWEPPSVPLEMLPQDRRKPSSIQPAGQRQRP